MVTTYLMVFNSGWHREDIQRGKMHVNDHNPVPAGELFMEMILIHMAVMANDRAIRISQYSKRLLESFGITVNELETRLTELRKEGNKVIHSGIFKISFEKRNGDQTVSVKSEGIFTATINEAGAIRIEYCGDKFKQVSQIANLNTGNGNIIYQISEVISG